MNSREGIGLVAKYIAVRAVRYLKNGQNVQEGRVLPCLAAFSLCLELAGEGLTFWVNLWTRDAVAMLIIAAVGVCICILSTG